MTREQDVTIDRLAHFGAVLVDPPFSNGNVTATLENGAAHVIAPSGRIVKEFVSHRAEWADR